MTKGFFAGFLGLIVLVSASGLAVASPTDVLRGPLDQAVLLLKDPKYQTDDPGLIAEQRDKIWDIVAGTFDLEEVSRRALARNWKSFSPEQQKDFVAVFSKMLGNIYVDRIQTGFSDQKVEFDSEILHDAKPLAIVKTFIVSDQNKIPVDYSLKKKDDHWLVYDVKVEGVSLISNYRSSYQEIVKRDGFDGLLAQMEEKIRELKSAPAEAG